MTKLVISDDYQTVTIELLDGYKRVVTFKIATLTNLENVVI